METTELIEIISRGEDGKHQFKANVTNATSMAQEMVAFSNSGGGTIFIGVSDDGTFAGLTREDMGRLNQPELEYRADKNHCWLFISLPSSLMVVYSGTGLGRMVFHLSP